MEIIELLDQSFFDDKSDSVLYEQATNIRLGLIHRLVSRNLTVHKNLEPPYSSLQDFLKKYPVVKSPEVGSYYLVGSIIVLSEFNQIDWVETLTPAELINTYQGQWNFNIFGRVRPFPQKDKYNDKQLRKTMVFNNQEELDSFLTVIHTTFNDWKLTKKILGSNR